MLIDEIEWARGLQCLPLTERFVQARAPRVSDTTVPKIIDTARELKLDDPDYTAVEARLAVLQKSAIKALKSLRQRKVVHSDTARGIWSSMMTRLSSLTLAMSGC